MLLTEGFCAVTSALYISFLAGEHLHQRSLFQVTDSKILPLYKGLLRRMAIAKKSILEEERKWEAVTNQSLFEEQRYGDLW
jgi:hypothetical protein